MNVLQRAYSWLTGKSYTAVDLFTPVQQSQDQNLVKLSAETWAYVCATYVATAIAKADYGIYATTNAGQKALRVRNRQVKKSLRNFRAKLADDVKEVLSHPLLDLLEFPNPRQTKFEFFCETQTYLDTTGDTFWLVQKDGLGVPFQLDILPTERVKIIVNDDGTISHYEYRIATKLAPILVPVENMVHFRTPNVINQYTGMGCLEASVKAATLMESMADLEIALNKNLAIPSMVVTYTQGSLKEADRVRLEEQWNAGLRGIQKAGRIKVADNQFEVKILGLSPREMQFLSGRKWSREEICAAYRVPISLVTSESVNRANAEAGQLQFAVYGIQPRLQLLEETINRFLIPMYQEPRIFLEFESPVPEDRNFSLQKFNAATAMEGAYTTEELKLMLEKI